MKILITGGTGLVGKGIQEFLFKNDLYDTHTWYFLGSKDMDLRNKNSIDESFDKIKPDIVVHLAANVGGLFKNMEHKLSMYEENLLMNTYILQACVKYKVQKIITTLTTCMYPDGIEQINEYNLHQGPPHPSNEGYAYAKRMMDIHTKLIHTTYGIPCINIIPTNIYGKYDNYNLNDGHVLPCLLHKCFLAKENNTTFKVLGSGRPLRQFIYNKDLARIVYSIINDTSIKGHRHMICSPPADQEISIRDLSILIAKKMGYDVNKIEWDTSFADGQFKKTVNPSDEVSVYMKDHWTTIEKGLEETIDWFVNNYPNIRL